jgi:putative heme iron utilization protein
MTQEIPAMVVELLQQRQAILATVSDGNPHAGMVAVAGVPDGSAVLLHLSQLAAHTRHLLVHPALALLWCEPDHADVVDVQTLARLTLYGTAQLVARDDGEYASLQAIYLRRLPAATMLFDFRDFNLFKVVIDHGRFVGGFGKALNLSTGELQQSVATAVRQWSSRDHSGPAK